MIKKQITKKRIPVEKVILFLAAGFAAYNFSLAGGYIEGTHYSIGGAVAGIVVNMSLAIAASNYGAIKGDKRTRQAQLAFVAMMVLSPIIVSPVIFYSLPKTYLEVWYMRAIWSVLWPLVADFAIVLAGAATAGKLLALSDATPKKSAKGAKKSQRGAAQVSESVAQVPAPAAKWPQKCQHCDVTLEKPASVGGHMKKHHPELCKPKTVLAESLFKNALK